MNSILNHIPEIIRQKKPLIHNITNYVSANDCANLLLACGASPIMADAPEEAAQIAAHCDALNLNLGIPNQQKISAMLKAGMQANALNRPVIFDPVGAGASEFRRQAAERLMQEIAFTAVKGNASEIRFLAQGAGTSSGVDADFQVTEQTIPEAVQLAKNLAIDTGAVIIMTGQIDIVSDAEHAYMIHGGHAMMKYVTGAGCMLSALTAACLAVSDSYLNACASAVCMMGIAGELAAQRMTAQEGNASFRNYLIDAIFHMNHQLLEENANYEIFC